MLQATATPITRRSLIVGAAAAVPAATIGGGPPLFGGDAELLALEPIVRDLWERYQTALETVEDAEEAVLAWLRRNPEPVFKRPVYRESPGDDPREWSARKKAWRLRKETAEQQAGLCASRESKSVAEDRLYDAITELYDKPAATLGGCRCKARMADKTNDADLAWSVVGDLLQVAGA